jgi:hypothetical protein
LTKLRALKSALLLTCAVMPGVASAQSTLPTIEVVGVAPLPGGAEIDKDNVPSNVQSIGAADLSSTKSSSLLDGMVQYLFNQHYYSAGTVFDPGGFNNSSGNTLPNLFSLDDPRSKLPGMPLAAYAGIRMTF